ncbi:RHS repeat-associated core domain-containing protein [Brevibacillus sp. TJ4]|uniref:RHS repeat-associated core domain-containing protein n=1 Tax=Brevibacillus sp. TJ4 TaxID=3234853 RepID=UPI003B9F2A7A
MANPFLCSGEMYDEKAGLYYLRARYYDPSIGRFISEDTYKGQVDNPLNLNRYTYVHNNPLRYVDPTGHAAEIGGSSINRPGDMLLDERKRAALLDIYKRYGLEAVPEMYRDEVQILSGDVIPGAAGVRIVRSAGKAVITAINGAKVSQVVQLSKNDIAHILNRHSVSSVKQQVQYWQKKMSNDQINEMLSKRTFFNKDWSEEKIIQASQTAYNYFKNEGVKDGLHIVKVFGEELRVFIRCQNRL